MGRIHYSLEEHALFWASLDDLDESSRAESIAEALDILTRWVMSDPHAAPAQENGIRIAKLPSITIGDVRTPPLKLAYYLVDTPQHSGAEGVVTLLSVDVYDEAQDLLQQGGFSLGEEAGSVTFTHEYLSDKARDYLSGAASDQGLTQYPFDRRKRNTGSDRGLNTALLSIDDDLGQLLSAIRQYRFSLADFERWAHRFMRLS